MYLKAKRYLRDLDWLALAEWVVLGMVMFSILWRGGKGLEATWILVGVSVFALVTDAWKGMQEEVPWVLWCSTMGLILWTALSYSQSLTANYGLDEVLRTTSLGLLFFWAIRRSLREPKQFPDRLLRSIVYAALVACVVGMFVYILQPVNRFVGPFFDVRFHTHYWPNAWAEFVLMAWPIVLWWLLYRSRKCKTFLTRALVLSFVLGTVFLSYSRGAVVTMAAQMMLWAWIAWTQRGRRVKWKALFQRTAIVGCFAVILFGAVNSIRSEYHPVQSVEEKVTFTADEGTSSISERAQFWSAALYYIYQRPFVGFGPYSFRFIQPQLQQGVLATSDHPHNVFLKLAVERGIPAALFFLALISWILLSSEEELLSGFVRKEKRGVIKKLARMVTLRKAGNNLPNWQLPVHISIVGVIIHNLLDYNLQFVGIALPFWMLLALLSLSIHQKPLKTMSTKFVRNAELTVGLIVLFITVIEGGFLVLSSVGRHAEAAGNITVALRWYQWSEGEWFSRDLHLSTAQILFDQGKLHESQQALNSYVERNDIDYRAWKMQARIYFERENYQEAYEAYQQAYRAGGRYNDLSITLGLVESLIKLGNQNVVDERREEFDSLLSTFESGIRRNAHFVALTPNAQDFIKLANLFAKLYPSDAPYYQVLAARVDHQAEVERERIHSQPPGYLW